MSQPTKPAEGASLSPSLDAELRAIAENSTVPRGTARSRAITVVAGYFNVVAVFNALAWVALTVLLATGPRGLGPILSVRPWRSVSMLITVLMQFRVGHLLHRRRRDGGFWAVGALATTVVSAFTHAATTWTYVSTAISAVGLGLIAYAWRELE